MPVSKVSNRQPGHGEYCPGVQAKVIQGYGHRITGRAVASGNNALEWWVGKVGHRLRYAPEHQNGADTRSKQHREPGEVGIIRSGIICAQADTAITADRKA